MSLIPYHLICDDCLGYLGSAAKALPAHACRCEPVALEPFEVIPREAFLDAEKRFREKGTWL